MWSWGRMASYMFSNTAMAGFKKNPDAVLARIDFNPGNIAPVVDSFKVDRISGLLPLKVHMSVRQRILKRTLLSI